MASIQMYSVHNAAISIHSQTTVAIVNIDILRSWHYWNNQIDLHILLLISSSSFY